MRVTISVTLESGFLDLLDVESASRGMSRSHFIELILMSRLDDESGRQKLEELCRRIACLPRRRPQTRRAGHPITSGRQNIT